MPAREQGQFLENRSITRQVVVCLIALGTLIAGSGQVSSLQAELLKICEIQGDSDRSPYANQYVTARGIVTLDLDTTYRRGFFMQKVNCDTDISTSDGIFIYLGRQQDTVKPGDRVEITGWVHEYYGLTEIDVSAGTLITLAAGLALPDPAELLPPFDNSSSQKYLESREGMLVSITEANVVGPTNDDHETWVVPGSLGVRRVHQSDTRGTGEKVCLDDGGPYRLAPEAKVGDHVIGIKGVLDFTYSLFRILSITPPLLVEWPVPSNTSAILEAPGLSIASMNLFNLFDTTDDPEKDDPVVTINTYLRNLQKRALSINEVLHEPAIIAVQEAENLTVLTDLVSRPEISAQYQVIWMDSADPRGIDNALLYRPDMIEVTGHELHQGCTTLVDGLGPDGNGDTSNPQNTLTCDSDANGSLDGNRLFGRPPLEIDILFCLLDCAPPLARKEMILLVNHWKSKVEDTAEIEYTTPRRLEQAAFTADLVRVVRFNHPNASLLVVGDLNDYPGSEPVKIMLSAGLDNLTLSLPVTTRYTYIFDGISQELDYFLADLQPGLSLEDISILHHNTDYPGVLHRTASTALGASDHDPILARIVPQGRTIYIPLAIQSH